MVRDDGRNEEAAEINSAKEPQKGNCPHRLAKKNCLSSVFKNPFWNLDEHIPTKCNV
jgi:hypothetical protein